MAIPWGLQRCCAKKWHALVSKGEVFCPFFHRQMCSERDLRDET